MCVKVPSQQPHRVTRSRRAAVIAATALFMGIAACGNQDPAGVVTDAGAAGATDAGAEKTVHTTSCRTPGTVCDGIDVHACVGGQSGETLEACQEACSFGRCTSLACAVAESKDAVRGCRFYGVQMDNIDSDDAQNLMLILSNDLPTATTAVVKVRSSSGDWEMLTSAIVPVGGGARIAINRPVLASGRTVSGAFRVDSNTPVLATEIVSDDVDRTSRSSGGTILRPLQALGLDHLALMFPQKNSLDVLANPGSRGGAGAITVVATADATHVRIGVKGLAMVDSGGLIDPQTTVTPTIAMDEGDVFQVFSAATDGDLSGTAIDADAPVAVFTGNIYTTYGYDVIGFRGGDLAMEQLPPTSSWGIEYVGARLSPQSGCDSWFGAESGYWRVIAADETDVTLTASFGVLVDPSDLQSGLPFHLRRGEARVVFHPRRFRFLRIP